MKSVKIYRTIPLEFHNKLPDLQSKVSKERMKNIKPSPSSPSIIYKSISRMFESVDTSIIHKMAEINNTNSLKSELIKPKRINDKLDHMNSYSLKFNHLYNAKSSRNSVEYSLKAKQMINQILLSVPKEF